MNTLYYLHKLNAVVNLGILGKISSYPTCPIAVILKMAMHLEDPELTAFARVGKGSVTRALVRSPTKTRGSKPSLQYGQHQLLTGPAPACQGKRNGPGAQAGENSPALGRWALGRRGAEVVLADSFAYSRRAFLPLTQVIPDRRVTVSIPESRRDELERAACHRRTIIVLSRSARFPASFPLARGVAFAGSRVCRPGPTALVRRGDVRWDRRQADLRRYPAARLVLGRCLARMVAAGSYVGVLLPPTVPAAVANLALVLQGKVPVNLNYTAGQSIIDSSIRQCGIRHVITSPRVLERFQIAPDANLLMLEEVAGQVRWSDKLAGVTRSRLLRHGMLERLIPGLAGPDLDSIATVIFTSGSTGDPKGVVLSHRNILSNVLQIEEHVHLEPNEVLLGILPFFHSFGNCVTIWTALALGKKVVYHHNPLDARTIGEICRQHKVTLIAGTSSFTRFYIKSCPAEQFKTLTHLILGAEKLKPELYRDINNWLGIEPMEGYGTTELSPVVAVNVPRGAPGGRTHGARQPAGHCGASRSRNDPQDRRSRHRRRSFARSRRVGPVRGPQVMVGYLNRPEATARVIKDGWYLTGDLGYVDADGFLKITDRLSRFSKIAGEMVPHVGVESAIMQLTEVDEHHVAVTAVPDPKHGERLCVVYTELGMSADEIHKALTVSRIPRLWIPSVRDFIQVPEIPITGTGKVDLRRLPRAGPAGTRCLNPPFSGPYLFLFETIRSPSGWHVLAIRVSAPRQGGSVSVMSGFVSEEDSLRWSCLRDLSGGRGG